MGGLGAREEKELLQNRTIFCSLAQITFGAVVMIT